MARKKKSDPGSDSPAWLITFSDLMTLLLTFFVLLVSLSQIDERKVQQVLAQVTGEFGIGFANTTPLSTKEKGKVVEPGAMQFENSNDLEAIREMIWEDKSEDINFQSNRFVQIISINEDVLFSRGSSELTEKGKILLNRMMPWLLQVKYPLLVAGHASMPRDEENRSYDVGSKIEEKLVASTWWLTYLRAEAVYKYFLDNNISSDMLSMEAFAHYRPVASDQTDQGRRKNRRVDIVLDKRNRDWFKRIEEQRLTKEHKQETYKYKDFDFKVSVEPENTVGVE